jgi:hypothetical protein
MSVDPPLYRPQFTVKVEGFRPRRSNTLFGFCIIGIPELRLRIIDLTVHESQGRRWASLPGKPQVDKDGQMRRDRRGKVAYSPVFQFTDKDVGCAFSHRVIEALLEADPRAFDDMETAR